MISLETIEREINEVESRCDTTYRTCERLAWLYVCRDHLRPAQQEPPATTQETSGSDFLRACSGVPYPSLMQVLDEHMSALAVVQPREYDSLMGRIRALRQPR